MKKPYDQLLKRAIREWFLWGGDAGNEIWVKDTVGKQNRCAKTGREKKG